MTRPDRLIVAVVGPTASGKSDLALGLADLLPDALGAGGPAELVGADAMQLYRGMDIGTAKTPVGERRGIVHHQIDVLDVTDEASVAHYQSAARSDVAAIHSHGGVVLVAGGSGLYLRALLDVIDFPGTDPTVRARLEAEAEGPDGSRGLHGRLAVLDPVSASRINPHNARRMIRALEVIELTGEKYSSHMPRHEFNAPAVLIGIRRPREVLDRRIALRVRAMFDQGLLEETRELVGLGLREGRTARRATGYAQALAVLDGDMDVDEAVASVGAATLQLARRQIKWFRPDPRIHWLDVEDETDHAMVLARALDVVRGEAETLG